MSENLVKNTCEPCNSGGEEASISEINTWMKSVPEWAVREIDGVKQLFREFRFKNFRQALAFTNDVGALAEEQVHHPSLLTEWGKVTVIWWTHAVNGLHKNDFVMAAKTDSLAND